MASSGCLESFILRYVSLYEKNDKLKYLFISKERNYILKVQLHRCISHQSKANLKDQQGIC